MRATDERFLSESAACSYLEMQRWPSGAACPFCRRRDRVRRIDVRSATLPSHKCYACRRIFTVRAGTMLQGSHLPLTAWLQAIYLMASERPPASAADLEAALGIAPKTARLLLRRLGALDDDPVLFGAPAAMLDASRP